MFAAELARRQPMRYKATGERWITIGGSPSGGKEHAGGTPVRIDGSGRITAGPSALEGRDLDSFALKAPKDRERNPQAGFRQNAPAAVRPA
jgi:hypothetical protein